MTENLVARALPLDTCSTQSVSCSAAMCALGRIVKTGFGNHLSGGA